MNPTPHENTENRTIALSIVIPVYNEEDTLAELLQRTLATCRAIKCPFEIILTDDGSSDTSPQLLQQAAEKEPEIISLLLNRNYGQHAAVFAGLAQSRGEIIITLDADLQNPPEEISKLFYEIEKGFDVVGSVRQNRQDSFFRRLSSALVNRIVQKSTGILMHDYGCMLRAYRRHIVDAMLTCEERSTFIPILANSFAASTTEIAVAHQQREHGISKYNFYRLIALQFDLLTSISIFPLRLLSLLGIILSSTGMTLGFLYTLLYVSNFQPGWGLVLFAALFLLTGLQFLGMGLLGEYLGRIYTDVRGRPRYYIKKTIL